MRGYVRVKNNAGPAAGPIRRHTGGDTMGVTDILRGKEKSERQKEAEERRREAKAERQAAKAARATARAEREKARTERYRAQTEARSKRGGAGMTVQFYDLVLEDRTRIRVPRRGKSGKEKV